MEYKRGSCRNGSKGIGNKYVCVEVIAPILWKLGEICMHTNTSRQEGWKCCKVCKVQSA